MGGTGDALEPISPSSYEDKGSAGCRERFSAVLIELGAGTILSASGTLHPMFSSEQADAIETRSEGSTGRRGGQMTAAVDSLIAMRLAEG